MSTQHLHSNFLNTREAAEFLRLSSSTLERKRGDGSGPRYRKHGGRVLYRFDDLEAWSESEEHGSTAEYGLSRGER